MKKLILAAAAVTMMSGSAFAQALDANAICGADASLPNAKWSWSVSVYDEQISNPVTTYSSVTYDGASGNGVADVTTTSTKTTTYICTALNPQGKVAPDKTIYPEQTTTSTSVTEGVQVCFQGGSGTDVAGADCRDDAGGNPNK
ncbi:MAG: hypothetical protein Q8K28_09300 [Hoeflea sp.]|uniref:hypothetical protein n=1 Tax=Hoeflea sp. TaxID=1940281 RepID=UPI0027314DE2|nr:hypothetical protein [Hoeflea sp.]MDP2120086.1 hypothetical protein [Hoeflea sp.]